jgi:hypothetical protein
MQQVNSQKPVQTCSLCLKKFLLILFSKTNKTQIVSNSCKIVSICCSNLKPSVNNFCSFCLLYLTIQRLAKREQIENVFKMSFHQMRSLRACQRKATRILSRHQQRRLELGTGTRVYCKYFNATAQHSSGRYWRTEISVHSDLRSLSCSLG